MAPDETDNRVVPRLRLGATHWPTAFPRRIVPFNVPSVGVPATILLVLVAVLLVSTLFVTRVQDRMPDFEVYWRAGARAIEGSSLYRVEDGHYQLKYLPAFALLVSPLATVPLPLAKALWFALSLGLLALLMRLSLRLLPEQRVPAWTLGLITFAVMAKFYAHELVLGQANILVGVMVLLALLQFKAGRETVAGLLLGGSVFVKPYAVIFLPYLVGRRGRPAVTAMASCLAVGLVLPSVRYGLSGTRAELIGWARTVRDSTAPTLTGADSISVFSMYAKWFGIGGTATMMAVATIGCLVCVYLVILLRRRRVAFPEYLEISLLLTLIPLLSPQGWDYALLMSTPAVVCLVNYFRDLPATLRLAVGASLTTIGLSLFDLMGRTAYDVFMSLSIITLCYFIVIGALYSLRARSIA